ncbi:hypothetical protein PR001_g10374 [Phytophthora rubi]|uniref:DDE-1 domain-containing protein n=1 Tax=Phytophthora rubi TaxID=129364 RepID=A0A6A3MM86_9STRA|nr:hypothetical protein PR002_g9345 [Phytophthora rubi]KAE9032966.1 hypothetical protein PR001_g10374 [Phytophthora rubi]
MKCMALAQWYQETFDLERMPGKSTVSKILREEEKLRNVDVNYRDVRRMRPAEMRLLERNILETLALMAAAELGIPAAKLPQLTRGGWCKHFLDRHGYRVRRAHGEIHSVDVPAAMKCAAKIRAKIAKYDLNNVFNVDEAAYFYKAVSRVSVCLGVAPALKVNSSRMTFLVGSNATGTEKLRLLVLGKSKKPRWLPEKPDSMDYIGTSKGWMTTPVFKEWLVELNKKMMTAGRKILLLYDNAPVHKEPEEALSHVEIARLPKNTTAMLQPMDQGVIAWIKARILNDRSAAALLRVLCVEDDVYAIDTADAMQWLGDAWDAMPTKVLANCWRHTGLLSDRLMSVDHIIN